MEGRFGGRVAGEGDLARTLRRVFLLTLVVGGAARLFLAFARPLWADEVFTLTLARRPLADLLAALRLDSGPPLHYVTARLILLPFPAPGAADVLVRLLSVAASLLHAPLLVRIGRRCGAARAGLVAASLFLVFPLAVSSGAEGRGYALASLLALASFERLLALEEAPRGRTALAAGLLGGAAVLTHYLAILPVAGLLVSAWTRSRPRRLVVLAGAIAAATAAAWLPVALAQPHDSMAWSEARPLAERALQSAANLGLGLPVDPGPARYAGPASLVLLALAIAGGRGARVPAAAPLLLGTLLLLPLLFFSRSALLPDRTALVLLPLVALVLAQARWGEVALASGVASAAVLALSLSGWVRPTPSAELAAALAPKVRGGARVVAAELWGPELDYRLSREGLAGRVTLFPSDVALHPGWYTDAVPDEERLRAEAKEAVDDVSGGQALFVFSPATRAGLALRGRMEDAKAQRVAAAGPFEVWAAGYAPAGSGR
ncbi:MAG: glycosyltransferase family 39 protein [Thermoanaerobaculia bacterium]